MAIRNFLTSYKVNYTATAASSATTEDNTSAVSTAGYESTTFIRSTSAARVLKVEGGATSTSATTDLAGCSVTATAGTAVKIEVFRSPYLYLRMTAESGVASVLGDCYSIQGGAKDRAVSNDGDVIAATPTDA